MAKFSNTHRANSAAHAALHDTVGAYHDELHRIARVEARCRLERALVKVSAAQELGQRADELKLSSAHVENLTALCW